MGGAEHARELGDFKAGLPSKPLKGYENGRKWAKEGENIGFLEDFETIISLALFACYWGGCWVITLSARHDSNSQRASPSDRPQLRPR